MTTKGRTSKQISTSEKPIKATGDTLHHLAFDNSLQANIIFTVSSGKIITANIAASKLLGYSREELLVKSKETIFDKNESSFKKMLEQRTAEGQSTAFVTALTKDGKVLPCEITSAVFIEDGIKKAITTITDLSESLRKQKNIDTKKEKIVADNIITAQAKSDIRLSENNAWIKCIAKTSYDVMWDWNLDSGDIYVGDSIAEVFGYRVRNNTVNFKDIAICLAVEEKEKVERKLHDTLASDSKSWKDSFTFKRNDGSVAFTTSRASIVRDENSKAVRMIGAIHDVSRLQELENKLKEQREIQPNAKLSLDVLWEWNLLTNKVSLGEGLEEVLGYTTKFINDNSTDWRNHLHVDDREAVEKGLQNTVASFDTQWRQTHRFTKLDGSSASVFNRASIFRGPDRKAYRMIGVIHHISSQNGHTFSEVTHGKKSKLIETIKNVILELVYYSTEKLQVNFSHYLSTKLQYDYTYLANLFAEVEGIPIQKFIIIQKIERAKELILSEEYNLTEIARKLQYSSVAHLSNQFKKVTGLSPTYYKQIHPKESRH